MRGILFLTALAGLFPHATLAAETVSVTHFNSIGLKGDGHVTIRYGLQQRVVLVKGSTEFTHIYVDEPGSGSLEIDGCPRRCPRNYNPIIEITTPDIQGLAIKGDGVIDVADSFPQGDTLGVAVSGDGSIEAERLRATTVHAALHGDGKITISVSGELIAAVNGDGAIRYFGRPHVLSAAHNGGLIESASEH